MTPLIKVLKIKKGILPLYFMRDRLQLTVCLAFIMLWLGQLKIFFVDIRRRKDIKSLEKQGGIPMVFPLS